jgi:hypothetical protein
MRADMSDECPDLFDLKWTLRDIKAERNNLNEAKPATSLELVNRGLVEIIDDKPVVAEAGHGVIRCLERKRNEHP